MKVKDYEGRKFDVYSVRLEADRDGRRRVFFYMMGSIRGDYGSVKTCCINVFRGVEEMDAALDLLQELRAGLIKEQEAIHQRTLELLS